MPDLIGQVLREAETFGVPGQQEFWKTALLCVLLWKYGSALCDMSRAT